MGIVGCRIDNEQERVTWPALAVAAVVVAGAAWVQLPQATTQVLKLAVTDGKLAAGAAFVGYAFGSIRRNDVAVKALVEDYRTWLVRSAPLEPAQRSAALAALDGALAEGGAARARYTALRLSEIDELEALVHDLRSHPSWALIGGKLMFGSARDLVAYRRHGETLTTIDREAQDAFDGR